MSDTEPFDVKHELLDGGFFYVNEHRTPDAAFQMEAVFHRDDLAEDEARTIIETTLTRLGAEWRSVGGSWS